MSGDPRVRQLLEEILDSGNSPEEVCRACPELLPQVRERLRHLRAVQEQVGALFPEPESTRDLGATPPVRSAADLPTIPGYEVQAVLGRGGMGVVFKAQHLRLHRPVALKMLLAGACATPAERERFLREAEAVAGLRHPHVVQVHDVGEHDGRPYFTMEFVEGGSLAEKLAGTPLPAGQAAALLATLAEAVHAAHQSGIVHRDLKPANILLTAEGMPKISDFGLARNLEGASGLTQSGAAVGTPSYMAPEQAQGKSRLAGPAADIYALGAILYELLTGRPPFRAETAAETVQQVISQEPVSPSRLNAKVPRDLTTICLKCLHKDPRRRYPTAAALAEDLARFQRGEPITARPIGRSERLLRWLRRNPTGAALVFAALALLGLAAGAGMREWAFAAERRAEMGKWAARLDYVIGLQQEGRYPEARAILGRVPDAGSDDLRKRIERAQADLGLAERLDAVRLNRAVLVEGRFNPRVNQEQADRDYDGAFRAAGLGDDDPEGVAARVRASNIRRALVAALDDWAVCAADPRRRKWLLEVARQADPDATGWRDRVRDPAAWDDPAALAELTRTAPVQEQSVQLLLALGARLRDVGGEAIPFLKHVQQEHPADFWANFTLGEALTKSHPGDSIRYYQAAVAVRPGATVAYNNLGFALAASGQMDEAIDRFRQALRLDPQFAHAHFNLGNGLTEKDRHAEALDHYREAVRLAPQSAAGHANLGKSFLENGWPDKAIDHLREAVTIDPRYANGHNGLGYALQAQGRLEEAIRHYRQALELNPGFAAAHVNLGRARKAQGRVEEALDHYRQALRINPEDAVAHHNLGLTLKETGCVDEALEHYRHALRINPKYAPAHTSLGNALAETGRPGDVVDHFRQAARFDPKNAKAHFNLALALANRGQTAEAVAPFEQALRIDPKLAEAHGALGLALLAQGRLGEAADAIRRCLDLLPQGDPRRAALVQKLQQCDRLLVLEDRLSAVLQGRDKPAAAEVLQFAEICRLRKRYAAAARLAADAFAADPQLADDVQAARRYHAARAAAQAGCGHGDDGAGLGEAERTRWRQQARQWLRADLVAWGKKLDSDPAANRLVQKTLAHWRGDPDLAGLREPGALDELPPAERQDCLMLWNEVEALVKRAQAVK